MPVNLGHAVTCAIATTAWDSLVALHTLDAATSGDSWPTVGRAYGELLTTLFVHSDTPPSPLPPNAAQVAAAVAGATEAERATALRVLVEVATFLSDSATALGRHIRILPLDRQPQDWQFILRAVTADALRLHAAGHPRDLDATTLTAVLTGLLQLELT